MSHSALVATYIMTTDRHHISWLPGKSICKHVATHTHTNINRDTHRLKPTHIGTGTDTHTHMQACYIKLCYSYLPFTGHEGDG